MRENDRVEALACPLGAVNGTDDFRQRAFAEDLLGRECPDTEDEARLEHPDLAVEVRPAALDLGRGWNAISALRAPSRKTADHRGDVNRAPDLLLARPDRVEPLEQPLSRGVGKGTSLLLLTRTGSLTEEKNARPRGCAADRRPRHAGTGATSEKLLEMAFEGIHCVRCEHAAPPGIPFYTRARSFKIVG